MTISKESSTSLTGDSNKSPDLSSENKGDSAMISTIASEKSKKSLQPFTEPDDEPVIALEGISTAFGTHFVHKDLDFTLHKGEIVGLIGGSGTGKSVLLHTILGLNRQREGVIKVFGLDMDKLSVDEQSNVRTYWGMLFQDGALFSSMTVGENIQFPLREFTTLPKNVMESVARLKLELVGLPQSAFNKYPGELSGGMRKRAGLARAIAMDPQILMLDEPTAGLDPIGAAAFDELILTLHRTMDLTVLMVTHDVDSLYTICSRVAVLSDKRILASGTIDYLMTIDNPWLIDYFQGPRGRAVIKKQ